MDKILLSNSDILFLDEFIKDFHRKYPDIALPMPLRAIEVITENDVNFKFVRDGNKLTAYIYYVGETAKIKVVGEVIDSSLIEATTVQGGDFLPNDLLTRLLQATISIYGEIMYFMVYGGFASHSDEELEISVKRTKTHRKSTEKKKKKSSSTVYILHKDSKGACIVPKGSHASPSYSFTVRGHLRHYKNGNTVWIAEYEKGGKQHKGKTYKVRRETPKGAEQ